MTFANGSLRRMGLAATAVGTFMFAWPVAEPAFAQSLNLPGLEGFADSVGGALTGLWGKKDGADSGPIDYRPRPALVVPPNYNLPPPQPHVRRAADWPKDPDAAALRQARQDSRRPAPSSDTPAGGGSDIAANDAPPPPQQQQSGRTVSCSNMNGTPVCLSLPWSNVSLPSIPGLNMIPGLGKKEDQSAQEIHLNPNPTRRLLSDPPVDYLEAVQVPENGPAKAADESKVPIERAPPAVDRTPPGK